MHTIYIESLKKEIVFNEGLFINGLWKAPRNGNTFDIINPANEAVICSVAAATEEDIEEAVSSAKNAFENGPWRSLALSEKANILFHIADLIEQHAEALAAAEAMDMGMLYRDSLNINIPHIIKMFRYYGGWVTKLEGRNIPVEGWPGEQLRCFTRREPLGVVAGITPFNFPLVLSVSKIAPALAAGNTFVYKPAPGASLSAIKLTEIIALSGIPPGVFNMVTAPDWKAGHALTIHPNVNKIAITGSTKTGKQVINDASDTLKHVTVELGGKSPNIIFKDADLDSAVERAAFALFWNKGQVCVAGSRLLVEETMLEIFTRKLAARLDKMYPGDPFGDDADYGPLSSLAEFEKVLRYIETGKREGAKLVAGGYALKINGKGYYIRPTLFIANNSMRIAREEIFGPVLTVIPFKDFDDAIAIANDSPYGLAAGVQTSDLRKALKAAELLQAGMVWLNTWHHYSPAAPFGGYKQSGYGRENGEEVLDYYLQTKTIWMDLNA
jgi:acyl-CoA reductase-like NAD-dependent aldehyde dehydrogenase